MSRWYLSLTATLVWSIVFGSPVLSAPDPSPSDLRPDEPKFSYFSPYTDLVYEFTTVSRTPGGGVSSFDLSTSAGALNGRMVHGESFTRVVLTHRESGLQSVVDFVTSVVAGRADIHLSLPERGEDVYFRADDRSASPVTLASEVGLDCATLEQTDLRLAHREALRRLAADLELSPQPPDHLKEIMAALLMTDGLIGIVDGCGVAQDPAAGACHLDYGEYYGCRRCCERESELVTVFCEVGFTLGCPNPGCRRLGKIICGGLQTMHTGTCTRVMCMGKPGDPSCPPEQQCGFVEGSSCWEFCGITRRSVCGACPHGQSCCAPL